MTAVLGPPASLPCASRCVGGGVARSGGGSGAGVTLSGASAALPNHWSAPGTTPYTQCVVNQPSPQAPFPFPRPAGAGESPGPVRGGLRPPTERPVFGGPLCGSPGGCGRPPLRFFGRGKQSEKCQPAAAPPLYAAPQGCPSAGRSAVLAPALTRCMCDFRPAGLTIWPVRGTLVFPGPIRPFGGHRSRGVRGRLKPLGHV